MKTLVVFDSVFGNTEKIARAMGEALESLGESRTLRVAEVNPGALDGVQLMLVGSPTRKFRPTAKIVAFLKALPTGSLQGVRAAAFDTRVDVASIKSPVFRFIVNTAGYAAKPISEHLKRCGAEVKLEPEGFFVEDAEGPLRDGELERAVEWAAQV